ncbi:similar to Saccharomyces cerevisiae YER137C Putative protein of unknown function [Maudiozyma barnettii]|uniref:CCHC-type domain-containing protein n=1 Tax=Maudiozyma barnettii TaxID=61262 RepID=A0A8H2ZEL9_9SACH|nr:hypothetical protein [Kazachstania barnettii]CAB4252401.1 similar to Saccharomyces cerevisiae YER137C Putative protein of unknown function [Kazachstania barnettii]CAD1779136.1 similar to Saccharomyces cerevisiae YER137C Putative protein of unknown function [Kazachstania barnettii]
MATPSSNSKNSGDDIKRVSDAMDVLAKLIIQRRKDNNQVKIDYEKKLQEVDKLINMILALNRKDESRYSVDTTELDKILNDGVEIIEKGENKQKYALIPIVEIQPIVQTNTIDDFSLKKKKKKNKINCSYCKETGHTRAACPKRLLNPKP